VDTVEFGMHQLKDYRSALCYFLHDSGHEVVAHGLGLRAEVLSHPSEGDDLLPAARYETVTRVQKGVEEAAIIQLET